MTETPAQTSQATEVAVSVVRAELAWKETSGGFECRISGASGAFAFAVPVALGVVALLVALVSSLWIAVGIVVLGVVLFPRTGGRLHGLRLENGQLQLLGPDVHIPLHTIERVDLTVPGFTLHIDGQPPIALLLTQSLGARAWLAERIRLAVVDHGDFADVPATLARLRGETEGSAQ